MTLLQRRQSIVEVKANFQQSSITTIFSSTTSMVGTGIIIFPLLFKQCGLGTSIIMVLLIGLISYKTASLILLHTTDKDNNLSDIIQRSLGNKHDVIFMLSAGFTLLFVGIVYFLFMSSILFSLIDFIQYQATNTFLPSQNEIHFDRFSYQYIVLICGCLNFITISLKDLKIIMQLSKFSFLGILSFILFLIYMGLSNLSNIKEKEIEIVYMTNNITELVGTIATSFMLHNLVVPIFKQNKVQANNQRDLLIAFSATIISYIFIGSLGYLAIAGKTLTTAKASTVMDYFSNNDPLGFVVNLLIFYNIFTILPLISFYGKIQLLSIYYKDGVMPDSIKRVYNLLYIAICILLGIYNISPIIVLAIIGSVCGFYMIYYLPSAIHLKCLYQSKCQEYNYSSTDPLITNIQHISSNEDINTTNKKVEQIQAPCSNKNKDYFGKWIRCFIYGILIITGISFFLITMIGLI